MPHPTTEPASLQSWDFAHSWHPFAQMREYLATPPIHIASGNGAWLRDTDGNNYLDGTASIWTNVHGHNDPDLNAALQNQLNKVAHSTMLGLSHPAGTNLARKLIEISPGSLSRCFFSDNGSNAVEIALKMSFQFWQLTGQSRKTGVLSMENSYHGDTFGAMAVGDSPAFHSRFQPWLFPVTRFPAPLCNEIAGEITAADDSNSIAFLENFLSENAADTACLIIEPSVQGAAGMLQQPPGFLPKIANLCQKYHIHLILDEVFTGFSRLGPLLVCTDQQIEPDFLCLAKGLTAGYLPLAATLTREEIYEAFLGPYESFRAFFHGHTFTGNPLAAAVSLASIEKLQPIVSSGEITRKISFFGQKIKQTFSNHPNIGQIRQRGLTAAIELVAGKNPEQKFPISERTGHKVTLTARKHGLLLRPLMDTLLLIPPIAISHDEIDFLTSRTLTAIDETLNFTKPQI